LEELQNRLALRDMPPDTVGLWLLSPTPPGFRIVTLTCYCNFLVCDSTVDTFDYHIKFILHKNRYQLFCFSFFQTFEPIFNSLLCMFVGREQDCNLGRNGYPITIPLCRFMQEHNIKKIEFFLFSNFEDFLLFYQV